MGEAEAALLNAPVNVRFRRREEFDIGVGNIDTGILGGYERLTGGFITVVGLIADWFGRQRRMITSHPSSLR